MQRHTVNSTAAVAGLPDWTALGRLVQWGAINGAAAKFQEMAIGEPSAMNSEPAELNIGLGRGGELEMAREVE